MDNMTRHVLLLLGGLLLAGPAAGAENLLRNGSFEGGLLYWHGITTNQQLVRDARVGEFALRLQKGVMSAPFVCERGQKYTVSFFVKAEQPCKVEVQMPASAREESQRAKRLWTREAAQSAAVGTDWRRVSFTWPANIPQSGFWPQPHYLIQIEPRGGAIIVDGVTVVAGEQGTGDYVPRRALEIVAECPDLPGYEGAQANLFEKGATVRVTAHVSNPGAAERAATVRWQLFDYEGERPVGAPVVKQVTMAGGKTISATVPLKLAASGCVLARVSIFDVSSIHTKGPTRIDVSEIPLTSLPYPKAAPKPDWRERFGGSFAGGLGMLEKFQKLGFGWIRWRPHMNGADHWPKENEPLRFFDQELVEQEAHGCSTHCVLYPPPKWIMEPGHPLPKDMRWAADDPRWGELTVETTWDKFVKAVVTHYKGRSLIYEIENEPELDKWDTHKEQYAQFTLRTARLIRQTDPRAKIMLNNLYSIPSALNTLIFKAGGLKHIDVVSWHDYHAGWLTDANGIKRMRQNLDEAGGQHVEIWFNEGWAFSNTAVDEPPACTGLTSVQSCHAIMNSVAEMSVAGQQKTILFHTGYERHGMSFWDYSGPGTMLWDWYNFPLPLVAAWNVLAHHIGVSTAVGFVRPPGANLCIFDDQRNGRGVVIAYADREAKADAVLELPDCGAPLVAEDLMGNAAPAPKQLVLSKTGRPVLLYSEAKTAGRVFLEKLAPLDRKHAGFVAQAGGGAVTWRLPPVWEGAAKGSPEGSSVLADGKTIWKLEQIWPPEPRKPANYHPMIWKGTAWTVAEGGFGGQPGASLKDNALSLETRAAHGPPPQRRYCALVFIAPQTGRYQLAGTVAMRIWDGKQKTTLRVLRKNASDALEVGKLVIAHTATEKLDLPALELNAGDELVLLPEIEGMFAGGSCKLVDLSITKLP